MVEAGRVAGGHWVEKSVVRKARADDAQIIHMIIEVFAEKGDMLPRAVEDIYDHLRDFFVCEAEDEVVGVASLHIWGKDIAEIRSLAVREEYQGTGAGRRLVDACLEEARTLGIKKVFALTYTPGFFEKMGFSVLDKIKLPQKIWGDCARCSKFPSCDETAVIKELS